jgi:hypothetical protein
MFGPMAAIALANKGIQLAASSARYILKNAEIFTYSRAVSKSLDVFHVTPQGVAIPFGKKFQIPFDYVENINRQGSYGKYINGKFVEKLRIDPATSPGMKGPNFSHYHLNGKTTHYSPRPEASNPGFNP